MKTISIGGREVGPGRPCFVVAEAGVNHNGDPALAKALIDAAAKAGADAVKFQTFDADLLASSNAPKAAYQKATSDPDETQHDMLKRLELPPETHAELIAYCNEKNIVFFSSPFEEKSCDLLDRLGVSCFKIPSGEITNLAFVRYVAGKGKPLIVSTGMSTLDEVRDAVRVAFAEGNDRLVLLHCVSNYPANPSDANLRAMRTLRGALDLPVGFSDHTVGPVVAIAAVALGACVIEKHLTLDRDLPGPDHLASAEPGDFEALVRGIRTAEAALGHGHKVPAAGEARTAAVARKSLVASRDLPVGTVLADDMICARRPGTGLPPSAAPGVIGRMLRRDVRAGQTLTAEDFE